MGYFERLRQIEETAEHIAILSGPISFLLASDKFQDTLEKVLGESTSGGTKSGPNADDVLKIMTILRERKEVYRRRKPTIVNLMSALEIERFLHHGLIGSNQLEPEVFAARRALAHAEMEHFIRLLESPPIGVQIGIVTDTLPHTGFQLFREPNRKILMISPFRLGGEPNVRVGVAMITSAPDGIVLHEKAFDDMWTRSLKGQDAARLIKALLLQAGQKPTKANFDTLAQLSRKRLA